MESPTLTIEEIKGNLCYYDAENPNNNLDYYDEEDRPVPRENCFCDNCFYGRDKLARYILSNAERIHGGAGLSKPSETPTPLDVAFCLA